MLYMIQKPFYKTGFL